MIDQNIPIASVIIPCKNHSNELFECLTGLRRMKVSFSYEIIVVDSASDPKVLATAIKFPEIKLIRSEKPLNAAEARNTAAREAKGDFLAFIDADCVPDKRWLQAAFNGLSKGMKMVGGPVSDLLPCKPVASADNILQFADLSDGRPEGRLDLMPGCNLGTPKSTFETTGGFPLTNLGEDSIFTSKIADIWPDQCRFMPDMRVFHKGRQNMADLWVHHYHFGFRRGFQCFRITRKQQLLGRFKLSVPLVLLKRLTYIFSAVIRWDRKKTARYFVLLPLIIFGLFGYSIGFQRGCASAYKNNLKFN